MVAIGGHLLRALQPAMARLDGRINIGGKWYHDFSCNDYLGLSSHPALKEAARKAAEEFGTGSAASRLLSGDLKLHHELEAATASFKGKEAALLFNSGYQANTGIISAVCGPADAVFCDRLSHASIIDGIMLSRARLFRFRHNDTGHLEAILKKERPKYKTALIVTETIFSMDGDRCPLKELVEIKNKHRCILMADEAHATGIFGKNGSGVVEEEAAQDEVELIMGTFGKALGSFGAYVACSEKMKQLLVNLARSFIYSTSLPPPVVSANLASLDVVKKEPRRRKGLLEKSSHFRQALIKKGFNIKSSSQIVPVVLGGSAAALHASRRLLERGYRAMAVRPPTVPAGEARLRISLNYGHDSKTLERLADDIVQVCGQRI